MHMKYGYLIEARPLGLKSNNSASNLTARILQRADLIKYHRGELTILDRGGLEEASCECFRVTSQMYDRMMRLS
jgi:hypothetical protein